MLSQKGAQYDGREAIANPAQDPQVVFRHVLRALDDLASQSQAIRAQGNFGMKGSPPAPHPITNILVMAANGFARVVLTHNAAPAGTRYVIHYSPSSTFQTYQEVDNGIALSFERYLKGQTLYFRAAPMLPTSPVGDFIYFGGAATPTAVVF